MSTVLTMWTLLSWLWLVKLCSSDVSHRLWTSIYEKKNAALPPFWSSPCGALTYTVTEPNSLDDIKDTYVRSLRKIRQQMKLSQLQLLHFNFEQLYIAARRGVDRHQYIPNWIPDMNSVLPILERDGVQTLASYGDRLTDLHVDLQKFAVAFEQLWFDEPERTEKKAATTVLIEYLRQLLCEVESTILSLGESVPETIPRSIMTPAERQVGAGAAAQELGGDGAEGGSFTARLVRDNGILVKYKEFLDGWIDIFKSARPHLNDPTRRRRTIPFYLGSEEGDST